MVNNIQLFKGDCLEIMKGIPSKSVDLVLIDPPYNISKAEWDKWESVEMYVEFMGKAFKECEIDPAFYANRQRNFDEINPWDHLDYGIRKQFLIDENEKAMEAATTPHCRIKCAGCGTNKLNGGKCDAMRKSMV